MRRFLTTYILIAFFSVASFGQSVKISGEVLTPLELKKEDLAAFKTVSQKVKDRDGKEHTFTGVALIDLLTKAGVTTGANLRGENLTKYVLIQAADGYEVIYALAEIDPEFSERIVMLAYEKDGAALAQGEGPFRIVASGEKKPARWIREVRSITIRFAQK